jgi:glutaredoxin
MDKEIVMITRGGFCTDVVRTHRALQRWRLPYREINIRKDPEAQQRCLEWNHNLSMPVIVIARQGEDVPIEPPLPLEPEQSPRDLDRGYLIAEPGKQGLQSFLARHGFLAAKNE